VPKVLVACRAGTRCQCCDDLFVYFEPHHEFQLCLIQNEGLRTVELAIEIQPNLVVLLLEPEPERLVVAEAFKLLMPEVPVFIIASTTWEFEKEALARGVDAVFDRGDIRMVIENAKAAIERQPINSEN
jgi:hypothetical protein